MKRYELYYKNDFGDEYPAHCREEDDGEWVNYEEAMTRIRELVAELAEEREAHDAWHKLCVEMNQRVEALESALVPVGLWLRSALKCKTFVWDSDQRLAAEGCLFQAQMAMESVSESGTFTKEMWDKLTPSETACEQVKCLHPLHHGWHDRKADCVHPMARSEFSESQAKINV